MEDFIGNEDYQEELIEEEKPPKPKKESKKTPKHQKRECKVILSNDEFSYIDFNGYGLQIPRVSGEYAVVTYIGEIGTKDFKIID